MKCVICKHGETAPGRTSVTLNREFCTVIIRNVPAEICDNCGEYYLSESVTEHVLSCAEQAFARGAEVEIVKYAA